LLEEAEAAGAEGGGFGRDARRVADRVVRVEVEVLGWLDGVLSNAEVDEDGC
jgi:hypothetical protein